MWVAGGEGGGEAVSMRVSAAAKAGGRMMVDSETGVRVGR